MKKHYSKLFLLLIAASVSGSASGQNCLKLTCPQDTIITSAVTCTKTYSFVAPQGVDTCAPNTDYIFTNCTATGRLGPSQSQANTAYSSTNLAGKVTVTGGIQYWVVPASGTYTITARGAKGGGASGGKGAHMQGSFALSLGDTLGILVGQMGQSLSSDVNISGGGGSYVIKKSASNAILVIAGGGGASRNVHANTHGTTSANGQGGAISGTTVQGAGGVSGAGGGGASCRGGGGAGWNSDGAVGGCGGAAGQGGVRYLAGGFGGNITSTGIVGGFGGGGSSEGTNTAWTYAGGGGGYSGGGGASIGDTTPRAGGGGSLNNGTNKIDSGGVNNGHGLVKITLPGNPVNTILLSGMPSGSAFPLGITTQNYLATDGVDSIYCSFNVEVIDTPMTVIDSFPSSSICQFEGSVPLPPATPPGGTYSGTGVAAGSFDPAVSGAGTFWVKYRDNLGCKQSDSTSITVVDGPPTSLAPFSEDSICDNAPPVALPAGTPAGGVYSGPGVSGTNFDPSLSGMGSFTIKYTSTAGCPYEDSTGITVVLCTGINEALHGSSFSLGPNPGSGLYRLQGDLNSISRLMVYNSDGKTILDLPNGGGGIIDLRDHADGVFLVRIVSSSGEDRLRLIKD